MAFQQNNEVPTTSSSILEFFKMRPITAAAKKTVSKIKSVRIFRFRSSIHMPSDDSNSDHKGETPLEKRTAKQGTGVIGGSDEKHTLAKVLGITKRVQVKNNDSKLLLCGKKRKTRVMKVRPVTFDYTKGGCCSDTGNDADVVKSAPDANTVKEIRGVSKAVQSGIECDSPSKTKNQPDSNKDLSCHALPNLSPNQEQPNSEPSGLGRENVDTTKTRPNMICGNAHESNDAQSGVGQKHVSVSPTLVSCQNRTVSQNLSSNNMSRKVHSSKAGVNESTSTALTNTDTGNGVESSCETTDIGGDVKSLQDKDETDTFFDCVEISDAVMRMIDTIKKDPIGQRSKRLARTEARYMKLMEQAEQEASKRGSSLMVKSTLSQFSVSSSTTVKIEEDSREAAGWRERNQKERLIKMLSMYVYGQQLEEYL